MPSGYWHHIEYTEGGFGLSVRTLGASIGTMARGLYNVSIQRKTDDLLRKLFKQKWFEFKLNLAKKNAERAINRLRA
jgi:hypothetical protein